MITENEFFAGKSCAEKLRLMRAGLAQPHEDSFAVWTRAENARLKALARLIFPKAIAPVQNCNCSPEAATAAILEQGTPVAHARFATEEVSCVVDFAVGDGKTLRIYKVVPKCIDLDSHRRGLEFLTQKGTTREGWRTQLESMAFKIHVISGQLGHRYERVLPFLVLPAKGAVNQIEGLHGLCSIRDGLQGVDADAATSLLRTVSVSMECAPLVNQIARKIVAVRAADSTAAPVRQYSCKKCTFYRPCWGALAEITPHVFDLNRFWFAEDGKGNRLESILLPDSKVSLWDIPLSDLSGPFAERQRMQIQGEKTQSEILLPEFAQDLSKLVFPVFSLDVETSRNLVPIHRGSMVAGLTIFQLSTTRQDYPGGPLVRREWLNTERRDPNREFIKVLREIIGDNGSILTFSTYESISLAELLCDRIAAGDDDEDAYWLQSLLDSSRIVDLHASVFRSFWAPGMSGKTSVKRTLAAMWAANSPIKYQAPFDEFPPDMDPYAHLRALGGVSDGCLAMLKYGELQSSDGPTRDAIAADLRRYVWLDAIAQNFIVSHVLWRTKQDGTAAIEAHSSAA